MAIALLASGRAVLAQSQITPGPPSIPLTAAAAANLSLPGAGITYQYGIEFVTIPGSTLNNAPWQGNGTPGDQSIGRGHVGYDYRMGRFEVTTAQWVAFFNAAYDRPQSEWLPNLIPPSHWGAAPDPIYSGPGRRWIVPPGNEMRPVGNISWRMAAMYCNWLHNDQSAARSAFLIGAYDVSTFGTSNTGFTDQFSHSPGAQFWIPTLDETIMAGHHDSNRNGAGLGGWWHYNITSDTMPVYGPPGELVGGQPAQANASWQSLQFPGQNPYTVSLGAYATVQSPWGLLDMSGGTQEWLEEIGFVNGLFPAVRYWDGAGWDTPGSELLDRIADFGSNFPSLSTGNLGLRIASAIPSPSPVMLLVVACPFTVGRRTSRRISRAIRQVPLTDVRLENCVATPTGVRIPTAVGVAI